MQIHELNTYAETPDDSTYLALDNGSETSKVPATDIYPAMTQSQITSGVNTVKRVLTAAVLKPAIIAVAKTITDKWVDMTTPNVNLDTSAASGDDYNLTQALTSLGWLSDVVTSGVLGGKKLLYKILSVPMVVEQGTSGIWTYRKWSDGIAEVWGRQMQSISANSSNANVYIAYPFTFAVDPLMTSVALGSGGSRDSHVHQIPLSDGTARTRIRLFYSNTYTATMSIYANIYVVGRWK